MSTISNLTKCQIVYFSRENRVFPSKGSFVLKYAILKATYKDKLLYYRTYKKVHHSKRLKSTREFRLLKGRIGCKLCPKHQPCIVRWPFIWSSMAIGVETNGHSCITPMAIRLRKNGHRTEGETRIFGSLFPFFARRWCEILKMNSLKRAHILHIYIQTGIQFV